VDAYNALQVHVDKRMSHGVQVGLPTPGPTLWTNRADWACFYNGDNPLNLRSGYASADFDRTHVVNLDFAFALRNFASESSLERPSSLTVGRWWAQPCCRAASLTASFDFTGAIAGVYYSTADGINNRSCR